MKTGTMRYLFLILAVWSCSMFAGCSTFQRDWDAMETSSGAVSTVEKGLIGQWEGTWLSDANGHGGGLRCIITPNETGTLIARYHATYARILTFEYEMPMRVENDGDTYRFAASADLGWLAGGRYEYEGTVVGDEFNSTYRSKGDHGTFRMQRVRPAMLSVSGDERGHGLSDI